MAKLILSLDGQTIKEYDISKERMTIGRKPHNDIQIDNLAVSGEHAMIMTILNDSFLEDLGSTNGTMVNGQSIKKHFLQGDDVVEIGKYKLKYVSDKVGKAGQQEFEKTMVLRAPVANSAAAAKTPSITDTQTISGNERPNVARTDSQAAANLAASRGAAGFDQTTTGGKTQADPTLPPTGPGADLSAAIQILSGPNAGRELSLNKPLTTLGKPGVQVAVIAKRPQGYFITHVEGASFPTVNGRTLDAQAHRLGDHDIIEIAGVKMEFFLRT